MAELFHLFEVVDIHLAHVAVFHHLSGEQIAALNFLKMTTYNPGKQINALHIANIDIRNTQHLQHFLQTLVQLLFL